MDRRIKMAKITGQENEHRIASDDTCLQKSFAGPTLPIGSLIHMSEKTNCHSLKRKSSLFLIYDLSGQRARPFEIRLKIVAAGGTSGAISSLNRTNRSWQGYLSRNRRDRFNAGHWDLVRAKRFRAETHICGLN